MSRRTPCCIILLMAAACAGAPTREAGSITARAVEQSAVPRAVDLVALLQRGALRLDNRAAQALAEGDTPFLRVDERETSGAVWIDTTFSTGTVEVETRGRNVPQRSFVGIAFGASNDSTYEAVYLRPFNFQRDSAARGRMVQYVAHPAHTWRRLREGHPGVYESAIDPAPLPEAWNRLRVVVDDTVVRAYVNGASAPSLTVRRLHPGAAGRIGLWIGNPSAGDFRRLRVGPLAR